MIKDAKVSDIELINTIMRLSKGYWQYDEAFLDLFMQKFSMTSEYLKNNVTKLYDLQDKTIGFYSFSAHADGTFELDNLFLHPDFIAQGFGRKLWLAACETAQLLNQESFTLWSDPHAEGFYLNMGCEKIGTRPSPMLPGRFPPVLRYRCTKN